MTAAEPERRTTQEQEEQPMANKIVITISREFGSGGRRIGERVAERLGIPFYDKKLIGIAAEQSGLSAEFIEDHEQKIHNSFLFNIAVSGFYSGNVFNKDTLLPEDQLFLTQTKIIRELAETQSCVIVGRCADYILRGRSDAFHVFVFSDMVHKIDRAVREYGLDPAKAEAELKKRDKARANHYNHYTGRNWGETHNYHLSANSDYLGAENLAEMIVGAVK
jgi:cytidylate kinase